MLRQVIGRDHGSWSDEYACSVALPDRRSPHATCTRRRRGRWRTARAPGDSAWRGLFVAVKHELVCSLVTANFPLDAGERLSRLWSAQLRQWHHYGLTESSATSVRTARQSTSRSVCHGFIPALVALALDGEDKPASCDARPHRLSSARRSRRRRGDCRACGHYHGGGKVPASTRTGTVRRKASPGSQMRGALAWRRARGRPRRRPPSLGCSAGPSSGGRFPRAGVMRPLVVLPSIATLGNLAVRSWSVSSFRARPQGRERPQWMAAIPPQDLLAERPLPPARDR